MYTGNKGTAWASVSAGNVDGLGSDPNMCVLSGLVLWHDFACGLGGVASLFSVHAEHNSLVFLRRWAARYPANKCLSLFKSASLTLKGETIEQEFGQRFLKTEERQDHRG